LVIGLAVQIQPSCPDATAQRAKKSNGIKPAILRSGKSYSCPGEHSDAPLPPQKHRFSPIGVLDAKTSSRGSFWRHQCVISVRTQKLGWPV
jgi:hypothetical protein